MRFTVTRTSKSLVAPSSPTPRETLPPSVIVRVAGLRHLVQSLHVFGGPRGGEPARVLREVLVEYYPFAGRFVEEAGGEVRVVCTGEGVWFVEAVAACSLEDVKHLDHPMLIPKEELLPEPAPDVSPLDRPLMMQVPVHQSPSIKLEAVTSVFRPGKLAVELVPVDHNAVSTPSIPILIVAPKDAGTYPVAMLLHGFFLKNHFYERLLKHVASHGFIMIAPQFHTIRPGGTEDIAAAAKVTDWLPEGLPSVLPKGVEADLSKLALAGHSRGGHTAFSLALGHGKTNLNFAALIGLDPVAGTGKSSQLPPKILTYKPSSFDVAMPVLIIGTGLGEEKKNILFPPCAPKHVNHREFYHECKPPCYYFVIEDCGHLDMLDDDAPKFITCLCKDGDNCKDKMRRAVAGIMIAFLRAVLEEKDGDIKVILKDPGLAPATLDPVECRLP